MKSIVIWGIGGHAREVAQLVEDIEAHQPGSWTLKGFLVDKGATTQHPQTLPAPLLGGVEWWAANPDVWIVVAVGNPKLRQQISEKLKVTNPRSHFATLVHPTSRLVKSAKVGNGSVVFAQSYVSDHVQIGQHASINFACTLNHDTALGDFVSLGPRVSVCGGVKVDSLCELGASVTVIPNVRIHSGVRVGAGAVVTRSLASGVTAIGVPARAK